jgi:uncharacterized protein (DUF2164 family)
MDTKKLVPYSLYLPQEHHDKLKKAAKEHKASELVRNAIDMLFEGTDLYTSGYNQGLKDAAKVIYDCKEAQMIAIKGKDLGLILSEQVEALRK